MRRLTTIETDNEHIRFAIHQREDGLLRVDEEKLIAGDEYSDPYWSFDQVGLFETRQDVANYLSAVSPRPKESWLG